MAGVWDGLRVLDLSSGIAGPMVTMLLADNGADVIKIEPPGGDPFRFLSGARVWHRGKRSAVLDLTDPAQRDELQALAAGADVLIESFAPGVAARLGLDDVDLRARNPRLVYCAISGYGRTGPDADRPAFDALVSARSGHQWESRGQLGGLTARLSGTAPIVPDLEVPVERWEGPPREGPLFGGVPWPSIGAAHLAHLAISAALRVREITGRGQRIDTSLLDGALASAIGSLVAAEHADAPGFQSWVHDPRASKGYFRCADDRWVHQWTPIPGIIAASTPEGLVVTPEVKAGIAPSRVGVLADQLPRLHQALDVMTPVFARHPSAEWERAGAEAGIAVQTVRSPEEALRDPLLVADGCVTEVDDPEFGPIRQVGRVYRLDKCDWGVRAPAPAPGAHTAEVRAEARRSAPEAPAPATGRRLRHPLEGVRVIDFSLAVAGPFGAQLLAELGADVVKVCSITRPTLNGQMHGICERSKRSIALDLKHPEGLAVFHRLVEGADVVATNMREQAVKRLGLDYEALRSVNPGVIYCHTRGHEDGPRKNLTGHDQSSACIAGVTWLEGGLDDGGRPHWPSSSIGDTGNGFLWASAVVQALYHRERTGEGQKVDTAIVNTHLLNASMAWTSPDGAVVADRPRLDRMAMGWNALYRLYSGRDGWLCVAALTDAQFGALCGVLDLGALPTDPRFATAAERRAHDAELIAVLESAIASRSVGGLCEALDACGVPAEVSSPDYVVELFRDASRRAEGRLTTYRDPMGGTTTALGLLTEFSETPGVVSRAPFVVGEHTTEILREVGYDETDIEKLLENRAVKQA